jgi:hypothetical protein
MADGRLFTDYRPRCDIQLENSAPPFGTHEYRQYLIANASDLIKSHRSAAFTRAYSGPCVAPYDRGTMLPEADRFRCDKVSCQRVPGEAGGLGTGRDYGQLPSHKEAMDRFLQQQNEMQAKLKSGANCCACAGGDGYFPMPGFNSQPQQSMARWTVPSGAEPLSGGDASVARG